MDTSDDDRLAQDTTERRQSPRIKIALDAQCRRLGRDEQPVATTTIDVSHGGARITAPREVSVGDVVELTVAMPHSLELTLQGLVVHLSDQIPHHEQRHAHLAFDSLSAAAADLLTEALNGVGTTDQRLSAGQ